MRRHRILALAAATPLLFLAACEFNPAPPGSVPGSKPAPGGSVVAGKTLVFNGDFSTGDFSQYSTLQNAEINEAEGGYCGEPACVVNDGPGHETAARFTVGPGDVPEFGGGERSEVTVPDAGDVAPGDERWYEFDLKFEDFPPPEGIGAGGHMIVMQWHTDSGSPLLTLNVDGRSNFTVGERWDNPTMIGPIDEGVWHRYTVHVKFSTSDNGLVEVWRDGVKVATRNQATHIDDDNYLKFGIYRAEESSTQTLKYDNFMIYK